jgi:uncharacterized membrane protein
MELVSEVVEVFHLSISAVGAAVVIWGVARAMVAFVRLSVAGSGQDFMTGTAVIRERLGAQLLLSLEIFIGADIINSVVAPSWENVGLLAAIVAVRTVLSYFLGKEVEQTRRLRA